MVADVVLEKEKDKPIEKVFGQPFSFGDAIDAVSDIYNGNNIIYDRLTQADFPLWYMGISGYEAFVMVTVSPALLAIRPLRLLVVKNLRLCHLLSLAGLLAYMVEDISYRMFIVGFGVWMSCLSWAATCYSEGGQPGRLESKISAWLVGLIASSAIKFAWHTSNPIWVIANSENGGHNGLGFILAVLAVLRSTRKSPVAGSQLQGHKEGSSILAGLGIAGVFFGMHSLLSDSSTIILWTWEGYPVKGPISAPHGALTIAAMAGGLVIGLFNDTLARSWTFFGLGSIGAALLTTTSNWTGYYGGLALSVYLMAVAVPLIGSAARKNPAVTFGFGFLVYNFMVLFHVWVVAYAFVPGGPLVRERTDWIMIATMLLIGCGVFTSFSSTPVAQRKRVNAYLNSRKQRAYYIYVLGAIQLFSVAIAYLRFPTNDYVPYHKDDKILTAGIWTIHFSLDNEGYSSEYRMRDLIKEMEIDVIGLLETDNQRIIMGNRDPTQFLAEDLGMYVDYGPGPNKHTWGAALLSKFPIVNSTHHLLPSPVGELAPTIEATLDVYGEMIDVFVFHSGQEEDPEDRRLQTEYMSKLMGATPRPAILLSYLVTKPLEGNYNGYVSAESGMHDIDPSDWDRWCEYILYKGLKRTGYARVSRSTITDTELQVGKFLVGEKEAATEKIRNARINEDQVPEGRRFPQLFRGEGVRGHRYHVFDEPRYYA
ncbi:Protein cwh43 [Lachnellula suecica]|uniref:Protein cwh43 n=1 Tax=Lachnellula suecica TaxID=602035 RepID=A0A8T9BZ09_9HELO|nr:Protein cwh43 [Lachnellula suecica]